MEMQQLALLLLLKYQLIGLLLSVIISTLLHQLQLLQAAQLLQFAKLLRLFL